MQPEVTRSTAVKANRKALFLRDRAFRRWLVASLCAWALGLPISVCILLQFPVLTSEAQTTDCNRDSLPPDQGPHYFPTEVFGVWGPSKAAWYSCFLRAMYEKPLTGSTAAAAMATYRLTVIPPWRPPFIVRLKIQADGSGILVKKEARSQTETGTLTINTSQDVSREDVEMFESLLSKADFWSLPTIPVQRNPRTIMQTMDGVVWVVEGASEGSYHVVTRTSPKPGPYVELTSYLFKDLAHFEVPPIPPIPRKHKH